MIDAYIPYADTNFILFRFGTYVHNNISYIDLFIYTKYVYFIHEKPAF